MTLTTQAWKPVPLTPFEGARKPWSAWQRGLFLGIVIGLVGQAYVDFTSFAVFWNIATLTFFSVVVGAKVLAVFAGQFRWFTTSISAKALKALENDSLPVYTVLVPLYKERDILEDLIVALKRLDYPTDKLDIQLLLEENDLETQLELQQVTLPPHIREVVVPDGRPRTKPRACNYGLEHARGEYLVVFDAEDRPEPDQLKKAVIAFRKMPRRVACLQARLNFYNGYQNLLTRWFTLEYSAWFDLYLPGLHAMRSPIPLGGTSNHFKVEILRRIGGWDPWNVTEDCDLGIRLSRARCGIRVLESTTWEEAPCKLRPWMTQRSRWIKGYWQTFLVHTRSPFRSLWQLGPWKFLMMALTVGGQVMTLLLMPVCWAILGLWYVKQWKLFDPREEWSIVLLYATILMGLFNGYFVLIHLIGGLRRRYYRLMLPGLFMPLYWLMMSLGGWLGFLQFFSAPFAWLKTPHGLFKKSKRGRALAAAPTPAVARPLMSAIWTLIPFAAGAALLIAVALSVPDYLDVNAQITNASVRLDGPCVEDEKKLDASWFNASDVTFNVALKRGRNPQATSSTEPLAPTDPIPPGALRAVVYLKVMDGDWYQTVVDDCPTTGDVLSIRLPLTGGAWTGAQSYNAWGQWDLRRVRAAGVRIFGAIDSIENIRIKDVIPSGKAPEGAFQAQIVKVANEAPQYKVYEARFELAREYENPFDPGQVDLWGKFKAPSGKEQTFPAFYGQDYMRKAVGASESLYPSGKPYWAVRFMPSEAGVYNWRLSGKDHTGATIETLPRSLRVTAAPGRGYLKADAKREYFVFENGEFFYPISLNLCWPRDGRTIGLQGFNYKNPNNGTLLFGDFFRQMNEAHVSAGRVWMTPWWCGLEWRDDYPSYYGIGKYSLQNAWRMDYLMQQAEKNNIMLEITLNHHGPWTMRHDEQWASNPYNVNNGGFLNNHPESMTDPRAKELFKRRHRYCIARYGAYPNLYGWVMGIEVEVINGSESVRADWHKEMGEDIRKVDGGRHMLTTEFLGYNGDSSIWELDQIDYTQAAGYTQDSFVDVLRSRTEHLRQFGKPAIIEEYGGHAFGTSLYHLALQIHNAPWIGWNTPMAGTPMPWWWNFIFDWKLERYWGIFADYIKGENLSGKTWKFEDLAVDNAPGLRAMTRVGSDRAYAWVYHNRIAQNPFNNSQVFTDDPKAKLFEPVEDTGITINGLKNGRYAVECWSTWIQGKVIKSEATVTDGKLHVKMPILSRDIAIKIYPL
ncbi:MAG: glycosyltransferase [Candidatus Sumerlaeota bacterium]|nr:glycosyltransferase [Candidatus Sumerlaeota bacterium]